MIVRRMAAKFEECPPSRPQRIVIQKILLELKRFGCFQNQALGNVAFVENASIRKVR